jgi:hypothetical protein
MNPAKGGTAAIDAALITMTARVGPQPRPRSGSRSMSRVWASWSTMPTTMNRLALKRACASRRAQPAVVASGWPIPSSTVRKPSWPIVPKARSCLRSRGRSARRPPAIMVNPPTTTTIGRQAPTAAKAGAKRASRYTPAFTIAAEWR